MTSDTYQFCWKQVLTSKVFYKIKHIKDNDSLNMGPYMALIVPSSFYRINAGLRALSFSPGFNVHKLYLK